MSGRGWNTLPNGRRVVGHRKNPDIIRATRTPSHLMPDWTISIDLPFGGRFERAGKNRAWLEDVAVAYLRQTFPRGLVNPLSAVLSRPAEGSTPSGPPRVAAVRRVVQFQWQARSVTGAAANPGWHIIEGTSSRVAA